MTCRERCCGTNGAGSGPGPPVTRLIQRQQDGPQHGCGRTGGSCNAGKSGEMAGDDWTVVGSRGRPRKPRRPPGSVSRLFDKTVRASNAGGSTAGGTRGARRSAEAPADDEGSVHGGGAHDRQQSACAATPLPGWGTANGHGGALNGRAGRTKKRQAWVERSPAERVETLKRSVLDAKRDVQASGFYAALTAALHASHGSNSSDNTEDDRGASGMANGHGGRSGGGSAARQSVESLRSAAAQMARQRLQQQQRFSPQGSQGSGSSGSAGMAVDQNSGSSPMATDGLSSPLRDAAAGAHQPNGSAAGHEPNGAGVSPHSYAAAAKSHVPDAAQQPSGGTAGDAAAAAPPTRRRWLWEDVRELVVYGLGSFESGPVPRCQLALTLLLAEALGRRLATPPQLFDPAFTEVDKLLLREMGCALIPRNEHGRRVFDGGGSNATAAAAQQANGSSRAAGDASGGGGGDPSHASSRGGAALVYLAHCKPELCNALLDANWSPGQLASFAVIGNSMYTCEEMWAVKSMRRVFASRPARTLALVRANAVAETGIPESVFSVTGAFNDVSLHVVTAPEVAAQPDVGSDSE